MLGIHVVMQLCYAECHFTECHYAECCSTELVESDLFLWYILIQ
jgi:hypothetical protein